MASTGQRHFTFKHPLFKRQELDSQKGRTKIASIKRKKAVSGVWWEESVYYLWWKFLRRHVGYKKTCDNGGNGEYAKLYADFGNVHEGTFREWWTKDDRGARLFAEPPLASSAPSLPNSVRALTPKEIKELPDMWDSGSLLVVAVPLNLTKAFIQKKLTKLVAKYNKRKPGDRTVKESKALYPIATGFSSHNLKQILKIYDLRQEQPDLTLWEIGHKFNLDGRRSTRTNSRVGVEETVLPQSKKSGYCQ